MFDALQETFPDDVIRRLLRSILTTRIAPIAEEGDTEGLVEELNLVAQEAYEGVLQTQIKSVDEKLRDFYHIGDEYYEIAGEGTTDYNKLASTINLPPEIVRQMEEEEMQYEDALGFLSELVSEGFEREQKPRLQKLLETLEVDALRASVVRGMSDSGGRSVNDDDEESAHTVNPQVEARVRKLLETIDNTFFLSSASAARYVEAESAGKSTSMMATGRDDLVLEVQEQLEGLYGEVEKVLGDIFIENNAQMPLISLVNNRIPQSVYKQIEARLGLEGLEQVENIPLSQLDEETSGIVRTAYVRWQEADLMLRVIDYLWTRHLTTMEGLRHSIGLQAYGQKDPLVQYKVKAYELFDELKGEIRQLVVLNVLLTGSKAEASRAASRQAAAAAQPSRSASAPGSGDGRHKAQNGSNGKQRPGQQQSRAAQGGAPAAVGAGKAKIGRNDPCFCGSGRKFKQCHGR
ncbi:MAG: SEC-C metal-binding domain-containing protein [Chloroflexia bacterium]